MKKLMFIVLVCALAGSVSATTVWTGAVDLDWNTAGNWDNGVPNAGEGVGIRMAGTGPVIGSGVTAEANWGDITAVGGSVLTIEGTGTLHTFNEWNVGDGDVTTSGSIIMSGDSYWLNDSHLRLGMNGDGNAYLSGNAVMELGSGSACGISAWADSENTGAGYMSITDNAKFLAFGWQFAIKGNSGNPLWDTPAGEVNITGNGILAVIGDYTAKMDGYITDGLITGASVYSVYDADGSLFGLGENVTVVTTPEPATMILLGLGGLLIRKRRV